MTFSAAKHDKVMAILWTLWFVAAGIFLYCLGRFTGRRDAEADFRFALTGFVRAGVQARAPAPDIHPAESDTGPSEGWVPRGECDCTWCRAYRRGGAS